MDFRDLLRSLGVGTYTTEGGRVMDNRDLPPDKQRALDYYGNMRDKSKWSGNFEDQARYQGYANKLYQNQDEITQELAKRKLRR